MSNDAYQTVAGGTHDTHYKVSIVPGLFETGNPCLADLVGNGKNLYVIDRGIGTSRINQIKRYVTANRKEAFFSIMDGGEKVKDGLATVMKLLEEAEGCGLDRKGMMVLIGGGALLDMAGFAASIFRHGVRHIRIPTTLLAQVEAGIGTKNGVNMQKQKNFIGTCQVPQEVLLDPGFLPTLDSRHLAAGIADIIKVALMRNRALFDLVGEHYRQILERKFMENPAVLSILWQTVLEHVDEINRDPYEREAGKPLDFGQEWGHQLEVLSRHYLNHGEAVSIGMAIDSVISFTRGQLAQEDLESILSLLRNAGLPIHHPLATANALWPGLENFRRHHGGRLTVTLLNGIGATSQTGEIGYHELEEAVRCVREAAS